MTINDDGVSPSKPGLFDLFGDMVNAPIEAAPAIGDMIFAGFSGSVKKWEDEHKGAVMLVPGITMPDFTMGYLRSKLEENGYMTAYSNVSVVNLAMPKDLEKLYESIDEFQRSIPFEKMTIIGHSAGGVMGLMAAYEKSYAIERVVTLGSPVQLALGNSGVSKPVEFIHDALHGFKEKEDLDRLGGYMRAGPPQASVISYYSVNDGLVAGDAARHDWEDGQRYKNKETVGSHSALPANKLLVEDIIMGMDSVHGHAASGIMQ